MPEILAVTNASQKRISATEADLSWTDPVTPGTGIKVYRSTVALPVLSGLIGWWDFDENGGSVVGDRSGTALALTIGGTGTTFVAGQNTPYALNFNGSGYCSATASTALNLSSISIEAWIKSSATAEQFLVTYNYSNSANWGLDLNRTTGKFQFYSTALTPASVDSTTSVNTNTWQHLVATYDNPSQTVKLYVNGTLDKTTTGITGSLSTTAGTLYIGALNSSLNLYVGSIDAVRVYNRALTQTEVTQNYKVSLSYLATVLNSASPNNSYADTSVLSGTDYVYFAVPYDANSEGVAAYCLKRFTDTMLSGGTALNSGKIRLYSSDWTTVLGTATSASNGTWTIDVDQSATNFVGAAYIVGYEPNNLAPGFCYKVVV